MTAVHSGGSLPAWGAVLVAAERWGVPPWEIAGGDRVTWFWRWSYYTAQLNKRTKRR